MKLFKVEKIEFLDFCEYHSFIVRACDEEEAISLCNKQEKKFTKATTTITEISTEGKSEIILGSFNEE